ncbi:cation-translocating P-type ATPase [Methylomonas rivi]|uniref:Cation-transporting P-type ATPase n=1 Tax=Methylomonas rivi TaxID=2952226 RepID=A0ABT1U3U3_9GAMM|nr:HAD-IC family P-type ATPase [Methylomonas sp. WSC-6]MCQ8128472.1 cation-transporting P-type ATPase [Methylomonas sp. WSC-6]
MTSLMQSATDRPPLYLSVLHEHVAGRGRVKIPGLYRNEQLREELEAYVLGLDDVRSVRASTLTGNLIIEYASQQELENYLRGIVRFLEAELGQPVLRRSEGIDRPGKTAKLKKPAAKAKKEISADEQGYQAQAQHFWHTLPHSRVLEILDSAEDGLPANAVSQRLARFGPNALVHYRNRSPLQMVLQQFASAPVAMLGVSAAISIATGGLADAAVIAVVVGINAVIGYFTEKSAEETISALGQLTPDTATVIRAGKTLEIPLHEVVIGDVLLLAPGAYIPADARLLNSNRLSIDESPLTGESLPVSKNFAFACQNETALADRLNMVYMGTMVTGGNGKAVVVSTGRYTEIGKIQELVGEARPPETPMQKQIDTMGMQLALFSSGVCALVFAVGLVRGRPLLEMLMSAISLAVAAVPEGLPAVATTTLALGIKDMQRHKVLIRQLPAVENLGSVQVICLDKTGTLTLNKMSAVAVHGLETVLQVRHGRFLQGEEAVDLYALNPAFKRMMEVLVLCNESKLAEHGQGLIGSPTENALMQLAMDAGEDVRDLRGRYPLLKTDYRAEDRPYMVTVHMAVDGDYLVAVKGSPLAMLDLCKWHETSDGLQPLSDETREKILVGNERLGADSLRVLGVAYRLMNELADDSAADLIWLGLVGMEDMMRPGMAELMQEFHDAGIATVMITGDQSATAYSVGRRLGLKGENEPLEMVDSVHLEKLNPQVLAGLVNTTSIFSRVSPAHKLRIVEALQLNGKVVAMTGDGINDGPALKAANVGVTLGDKGSDVARSIADVVLEEDDLSTMITAIRQGRTIYDNIRKSLHFLLSTNLSEIEVMLVSAMIGGAEILNPMQLLWINLITDIFPGLALALEPPEGNVLKRPPRDPNQPIVSPKDYAKLLRESSVISAGALGVYGYSLLRYGMGPKASTNAFMSLTLGQLLQAYSCRSEQTSVFNPQNRESNRYLDNAIGFSVLLQILAVTVPALRGLLRLAPVGPVDLLAILAGAGLPLVVNESAKISNKRNPVREDAA